MDVSNIAAQREIWYEGRHLEVVRRAHQAPKPMFFLGLSGLMSKASMYGSSRRKMQEVCIDLVTGSGVHAQERKRINYWKVRGAWGI